MRDAIGWSRARRVRPVGHASRSLLFVLLVFPSIFSLYYVDAGTQVAIYSIVALGLGVLVGRVGMVSLGQARGAGDGRLGGGAACCSRPRCRSRSCCWSPG